MSNIFVSFDEFDILAIFLRLIAAAVIGGLI
mgnify:FL=1